MRSWRGGGSLGCSAGEGGRSCIGNREAGRARRSPSLAPPGLCGWSFILSQQGRALVHSLHRGLAEPQRSSELVEGQCHPVLRARSAPAVSLPSSSWGSWSQAGVCRSRHSGLCLGPLLPAPRPPHLLTSCSSSFAAEPVPALLRSLPHLIWSPHTLRTDMHTQWRVLTQDSV